MYYVLCGYTTKGATTPSLESTFLFVLVRVFANGQRDWSSISGRVTPKTQKCYLMPPYLTLIIISYGSRVSGAIQGKELHPTLHHGVVAIKKGTFRSPSTMDGQVTNLFVRMGRPLVRLRLRSKARSNSDRPITFTFGLIPSGKAWTPYPPIYGLNSKTCYSNRMALALNNPWRLKSNQTKPFVCFLLSWLTS